ncbi:hypothetical protein HD806DRAFT_526252 [Xylariaceae sp. AK1471]|nr:hypothetical protein HD806DRAFT_526252 [Xylariaceae sp. AK1471]
MPNKVDSVLEGVISRSVARKNDATKEAICNKAKATMARVARRLARKAQVRYRADLQAELRKIAIETAKDLQATRQRRQQELEDGEDSESNDIAGKDDSFVNMLLGANVDVLNEYHVIEGTEDIEPKEPDLGSAEPARQDNAPPNIPEQLMQQDMYPESDDNKDWMRDNVNSEDEEEGGARLDSPDLPGGEAGPENLGMRSSIISEAALRTPATSSTPRKSQQRSSRKIAIDSDDSSGGPDEAGQTSRYSFHIGKLKMPQAPKSPQLMPHRSSRDPKQTPTRRPPFPLRSHLPSFRHPHPRSRTRGRSCSPPNSRKNSDKNGEEDGFSYRKRSLAGPAMTQPVKAKKAFYTKKERLPYRKRSPVRPAATQPVAGSRRSPSPSPPSSLKRRQPARKSRMSVHTYSDRKLFRNMVGKLDGPDYYDYVDK